MPVSTLHLGLLGVNGVPFVQSCHLCRHLSSTRVFVVAEDTGKQGEPRRKDIIITEDRIF